jgi:3-oxoacyl-[acyl-carrier protein] reductase
LIDLDGYRVLVTGGSRGIGAACCRAFSQSGAAVLVHFRSAEKEAAEVLASLHPPTTGQHLSCKADLGEVEGVDALFEQVREEWGALDCLVNNAGIWQRNPLRDLDGDKLDEAWRVNVRALFLAGRHAVPLLEGAGDGSIVNVSSTAGQRGEAFHSPYAATKGAVIAMTKSWSTELAPRIRVNAVAPGWVDTDMSASAYADGGRERITAEIPLRRVPPAEDIAGPILFLASPLARHVTGEILNVNGGSVLAG